MDAKHTIEIFKAGRHVDMHGNVHDVSREQLASIAACYDPKLHEAPCVVGHPTTNAPAYGWVSGLSVRDDLLLADVHQLDPQFQAAVQSGRYKKRSAAFLLPGSPGNPTPDQWYLNHVGWLGAQAPAVTGLRDAQFAADAQIAEFSSGPPRWAFRDIASMLRRLRDWMIGREGIEATDQVLPTWQIDGLVEAAAAPEHDEHPQPAFAQQADREAALAAREQAIAAREAELLVQQQQEIARQADDRRAKAAAFAASLVEAGRLLPREEPLVTTLLFLLDAQPAAAFAMADGEQQLPPADALRTLLSAVPARIDYREKSGGPVPVSGAAFAAPPGSYVDPAQLETLARARAWMAEHPGSTLVEAVTAVSA